MKSFFEKNSASDVMDRIFQISFEPICIINEDGYIVKANAAWKSVFGYSPEELENRSFLDLIYAGETGITESLMENSRINVDDYQCINRLICKDGSIRFVEWRSDIYGKYVYTALRDITEKISHQKQIEEKENNVRMFFDTVDDLVFVADEQGHIFHTNMVVNAKLGYSREELLAMNIVDVHPKKFRAEATGILADMFMGVRTECHLPLQKKDGSYLNVETRIWFGTWQGKRCIYGIAKDLTKQRALLERYKRIFNNSPAYMAINDAVTGQFTEVNEAFLNGLGYTREEVLGKTVEELNLIPDSGDRQMIARRLKETSEIRDIKLQLRHKKGEKLSVIFSGTEIVNPEQKGYLSVSVNTTKHNLISRELETTKVNMKAILDNMPFIAWLKDENRRFIDVNGVFEEKSGKPRDEIIGKTDDDIWERDFADKLKSDDIAILRDGIKIQREEWNDKGNTCHEWFEAPLFDSDGKVIGITGICRNITDRKMLEMELIGQKNFLQQMLDAIPDRIFFKDVNSVYIGGNKAFADIFCDMSPKSIIGKTDYELARDETQANSFIAHDQEVFRTKQEKRREETFQLRGGRIVDLETIHTPFFDEFGKVAGLIGIARDITQRRLTEKQLRESEIRLSQATSSAMAVLWDWNIENGEIYFNEQWINIIGRNLSACGPVRIEEWYQLVHQDDLKKAAELLNHHCSGASDYFESELRMKHTNGNWVWVLERGRVIERDADNKPVRMVGTFIDIDQRKRAEERLLNNEKILSAVVLTGKELIENRDYIKAVARCFEIIGKASTADRINLFVCKEHEKGRAYVSLELSWIAATNEIIDESPLYPKISLDESITYIAPLIKNDGYKGVVSQIEDDLTRGMFESQNIKSIIFLPIRVRERLWGFIGVDECKYERVWTNTEFSTLRVFANSIEKTLERGLIERELESAKQSAETANLIKSQFVSNMSHEIRTPLQAIMGYSSMMKDSADDRQSQAYIDSIQKAGNNLLIIIDDILDISKIEAGMMELYVAPVYIRSMFEEIGDMFSLKVAEKSIELHLKIDSKVPQIIIIDEVRTRQILFNLVGNAVKFTDEGEVVVSLTLARIDPQHRKVDLVFEIKDTGIGIPESQQTLIFEPFRQKEGQSTKKYGGTGLGLSITKKLVDMMGGTVFVSSEPGKGSVFTVFLPDVLIGAQNTPAGSNSGTTHTHGRAAAADRGPARRQLQKHMDQPALEQLIQDLEKIKTEHWLVCMDSHRLKDVRKLSDAVLGVGLKYGHEETVRYANTLKSHADTFNLEVIKEYLEQYPKLIDSEKQNALRGGNGNA